MAEKTLADLINEAQNTGSDPTFTLNGTEYTFSPGGILGFVENASLSQFIFDARNIDFSTIPTADPLVAGTLWNNAGVLTISAG